MLYSEKKIEFHYLKLKFNRKSKLLPSYMAMCNFLINQLSRKLWLRKE